MPSLPDRGFGEWTCAIQTVRFLDKVNKETETEMVTLGSG